MSCDDAKRSCAAGARESEKRSRSLPIVNDDSLPAPRRSWRSIEELQGSPALADAAKRQFPAGASS